MTQQASPGDAGDSTRRTKAWQLGLVAIALGVFFLYVLIPVDALTFLFSALLGFVFAQQGLTRVGALEPGAFGGAVYLAGAFLFLGVVLVVVMTAWGALRRLSGEVRPHPLLLLRPWWTFGLWMLLACLFFMPSASRPSAVPGLVGALVLATTVWAVLSVGYVLYTLTTGGLSLAWRLARVSPFGAGLLTVGALACVGFMLLLGAVVDKLESRLSAMPQPHPDPSCRLSAMECTRRLFLSNTSNPHPSTRTTASLERGDRAEPVRLSASTWSAAETSGPEAASRPLGGRPRDEPESPRDRQFRECLDSQYRNQELIKKAWRIAAARVNSADAWDVVHATLLSVCLQAGEREDFERFFLRSIDNRVSSWQRRPGSLRTCSIDLVPEPVCDLLPEDEYVRSETQERVQLALCALGAEDQQVLWLSYFDELSDLEIAGRLGISHAAVRKRLQRAREKLQREFLQQCH